MSQCVSLEESQARLNRMAEGSRVYNPDHVLSIADRYEEWAAGAERPFLVDVQSGERVSYQQVNARANQYARLLLDAGVNAGDCVAIAFQNRPEFFYATLAIAKVGAICALVNTFARGEALAHALNATKSRFLLLGAECLENFTETPELLIRQPTWIAADGAPVALPAGVQDLNLAASGLPDRNVDKALRASVLGASPACYCFTSGTTGLPKAAIISHARWLGVGASWNRLLEITEADCFYCMLPLFHGAAGMSLTSNALAAGARIVVRRKFSARSFWAEVVEHGVTAVQYVGEICRYLVNQPPQQGERDHKLRWMIGAGMTVDVWQRFLDRFGQIGVIEGMGATESNVSLVNPDGKIGACARVPFRELSNARLAKYDLDNDCYVRDENGFLVECQPGEVGELLGKILDLPGMMAGRFEGYTDPVATEKKILRNAFEEGDAWFCTGDLLSRDEDEYYYFVDRLGDTFRWKSENVSTTEAVNALAPFDDAELINIYGVKVPDTEGRAGMAAIQMREGRHFDPQRFYQVATEHLPHYAVPLFVRVADASDLTPTFKLRKVDLQRQGYNPDAFSDPLFVLSHSQQCYVPYSDAALADLGVQPFVG